MPLCERLASLWGHPRRRGCRIPFFSRPVVSCCVHTRPLYPSCLGGCRAASASHAAGAAGCRHLPGIHFSGRTQRRGCWTTRSLEGPRAVLRRGGTVSCPSEGRVCPFSASSPPPVSCLRSTLECAPALPARLTPSLCRAKSFPSPSHFLPRDFPATCSVPVSVCSLPRIHQQPDKFACLRMVFVFHVSENTPENFAQPDFKKRLGDYLPGLGDLFAGGRSKSKFCVSKLKQVMSFALWLVS